jgi:hypothetical protein
MRKSTLLRRVLIALFVGLVLALISIYSVWVGIRDIPRVVYPREGTINDMHDIDSSIAGYQEKEGKLPASLEDLLDIEGAWSIRRDQLRDRWGHPFLYSVKGQEYTIVSLGHDGQPGGIGIDWDMASTGPHKDAWAVLWKAVCTYPEAQPTLRQFLFEVPPARGMVVPCLFTGLLAALFTFQLVKSPRISAGDMIAAVLTIVGAMVVSWFMAAIHISPGH